MKAKKTFKPIDTAFAILFLLLIALALLHVSTVSDLTGERSSASMQVAAKLERFRTLERNLGRSIDHLKHDSMDLATKTTLLEMDLGHFGSELRDLGSSGLALSGLTRLVEPYTHLREARESLLAQSDDSEKLLAQGSVVDRALQGTLFVVRNNIVRLGRELSVQTASLYGLNDRARGISLYGALATVLIFWPVRFMARRQAAKPIQALKAATRAVAEENWQVTSIDCDADDAVGELVIAFHTMAAKLQVTRQQRATAFQGTLASLVQTIEAKDEYTFNHSYNVSKFAELLARTIGLAETEIRDIVSSGMLHDIGKVGISDAIINKPGKLTAEEFRAIQEHPVIGGRIVAPLDGAEQLLPPVIHHHEHWDGSGYPHGLRGEEIPLHARIVAVADVFEALRSDRPYRAKMSLDKATVVLNEEAGKTLDPQLVNTFILKIIPKIKHLFPEPAEDVAPDQSRVVSETDPTELSPVHS